MIRHIVMIKLTEDSKPESVDKLKNMLEALPPLIPEIKYYEVGRNVLSFPNSYDLVLISEFKNEKELHIYRDHPEHVKVLDYLKEVKEHAAAVDYEF